MIVIIVNGITVILLVLLFRNGLAIIIVLRLSKASMDDIERSYELDRILEYVPWDTFKIGSFIFNPSQWYLWTPRQVLIQLRGADERVKWEDLPSVIERAFVREMENDK